MEQNIRMDQDIKMDRNSLTLFQGDMESVTTLDLFQNETFFTVELHQRTPAGLPVIPLIVGEYLVAVHDDTTNKCYGVLRLDVSRPMENKATMSIVDIPITGNQLRVDVYITPVQPSHVKKLSLDLAEVQANTDKVVFNTSNTWYDAEMKPTTDVLYNQTVAQVWVVR